MNSHGNEMKREITTLHQDLSEALVKLRDIQRKAQEAMGPQGELPDGDLPTILGVLVQRIGHLETEVSALGTLFHRNEEAGVKIERQLSALRERLGVLEEDVTEPPIVLRVVKKKRTVGKKTSEE